MAKQHKPSTHPITETDSQLFRSVVGNVKPIPKHNRIVHPRIDKPIIPRTHFIEEDNFFNHLSDHIYHEAAEEYASNGIAPKTLKQLKKAHWGIAGRVDLHGYTIEQARQQLQLFLQLEHHNHARCVLIIHGKGMNSPEGQPILRDLCRHWLQQHSLVLAYCNAPAQYGGSGAVFVLLKAN